MQNHRIQLSPPTRFKHVETADLLETADWKAGKTWLHSGVVFVETSILEIFAQADLPKSRGFRNLQVMDAALAAAGASTRLDPLFDCPLPEGTHEQPKKSQLDRSV